MVLLCLIFGAVLLSQSSGIDIRTTVLSAVDIAVCLTVPFVILWYKNRHGKQGCVYTANEQVYTPFPSLSSSGRGFSYTNIKKITQCKERDAIIINPDGDLPGSVYTDPEDYQAVWDFFLERCTEAEIAEPITGERYDDLFEIERAEKNE